MFDPVPYEPSLREGESRVLEFWRESRTFEALRKKIAGKPRWSFLDGPINANNPMGVHHAWGRTYKDAFQRFFAMTGHDQRFQNGFDCQGLWVEVEVEREMGFNSKRDIEAFGLERFIEACKGRVRRFAEIITQHSIRLGMWMDWDNSYYTMSDENNYLIWAFLRRCHERGFIYKGLDSMPWCPRCGTGISEQERKEGYRLIEDESVYVRLPLRDREGEYLMVWTTTPWTLAANVAAAVRPDLDYARVRQNGAVYYLASARLDVMKSVGSIETLGSLPGSEMVGWTYDGPFDDLPGAADAVSVHRIIGWDEVSDTEGTGIVHIAPGCGKEDFELGKTNSLPVIAPIDESGIYMEGFGLLSGKYAGAVAEDVYRDLKAKGLFYKQERYTHDYPHCWRCGTPLLFRAVDEWYIDMSWRDEIKAIVPQIRWVPDYGESQELDWLNNMGDWMISKKRYWGLALPIWVCPNGHFDVVGGREELRERAVVGWDSFDGHSPHRPWVDMVKIACSTCGEESSRIPEVGNPWLDAGIVPYSTVYYGSDREEWAKWIPADFVTESFPGQFRNWFYALLAMSTMIEGIPPFRNLLGYASLRDEKGDEMHRSRGNAVYWDQAIAEVSADSLRWLFCRHTPTSNLPFGYTEPRRLERQIFGTLWNVYSFLVTYARLDEFDPADPSIPHAERPEIDRWILSNLQSLVAAAHQQFHDYWISPFVRQTEEFIDELSNWYVRRNRRRFWRGRGEGDRDKTAAYQTLYEVMTTLVKLVAPVIPFLAERIWQNLRADGDPSSVHLCDYPEPVPSLVDEALSSDMRLVQTIVTAGLALREKAQQRVRQPLSELRIAGDGSRLDAVARLSPLIVEELNIKSLVVSQTLDDISMAHLKPNFANLGPRFGDKVQKVRAAVSSAPKAAVAAIRRGETTTVGADGEEFSIGPQDVIVEWETAEGWMLAEASGIEIALDVRLDDALRREGIARDVVRHIQQLRKDSGLQIQDRIQAGFDSPASEVVAAISEWTDYIASETLADSLKKGPIEGGAHVEVKLSGSVLDLWLRKSAES